MPALLTGSGRPGFYFRVLEEGEVGAGDEIVKVDDGPERMTVAEINALLYSSEHPRDRLERALPENQFVLHYQPRVSLQGARITGVEALVRWMNPERGLVPPGQFIPLAEELGLIGNIGDWVLRAAASQAMQWRKAGLGPIRVAVNISAQQFYAAGFLDGLNAALKETGLDPGALELEITESAALQDQERTADTLRAIRALGVRVVMDDFGTGYSSLGHLRRLPIDGVKIDRSFVSDLSRGDARAEGIVTAVCGMARSLGLRTVGEGVETEDQLARLAAAGCDSAQGYLLGRPEPLADTPVVREANG